MKSDAFIYVFATYTLNFTLNSLVGLIILWNLPVYDYGVYIIITTGSTLLAAIFDPALSQTLISKVSSELKGDGDTAKHLAAAIKIQKNIYLLSLLVIIILSIFIILLFFLNEIQDLQFTGVEIFIYLILVSILGAAQSRMQLLRGFIIGAQNRSSLLVSNISESMSRILMCTILFFYSSAFLAILINFISILIAYFFTIRRIQSFSHKVFNGHVETFGFLQSSVPLIPMTIYFHVGNQLPILFLMNFANINAIAEFGALSRLMVVFSLINVSAQFFVQPIFSGIVPNDLFWKNLSRLFILFSVFSILLFFVVTLFSTEILIFLGEDYTHLSSQLYLFSAGSAAMTLGSLIYMVNISQFSTRLQIFSFICPVFAQIIVVSFVNIDTSFYATVLFCAMSVGLLFFQLCVLGFSVIKTGKIFT